MNYTSQQDLYLLYGKQPGWRVRLSSTLRCMLDWFAEEWPMVIMGILAAAMVTGLGFAIAAIVINAINAPSSGIIAGMQDDPETTIPQQMCTTDSNGNQSCYTYYEDIPETWSLYLRNAKEKKEGWVEVTQDTYTSHKIGDYINLGGN